MCDAKSIKAGMTPNPRATRPTITDVFMVRRNFAEITIGRDVMRKEIVESKNGVHSKVLLFISQLRERDKGISLGRHFLNRRQSK